MIEKVVDIIGQINLTVDIGDVQELLTYKTHETDIEEFESLDPVQSEGSPTGIVVNDVGCYTLGLGFESRRRHGCL
ncbi:hypothetical protein TNCV_4705391 [Trichonephila clavipes]|nr:hypothetical protein TNCV_4705391 [Trichonephila clavipes]